VKAKRVDPGPDRVVRFIKKLTHSSGDYGRQPFRLRPWQEKIVRELFKTRPETGKRQHRTALLMFPRKNGKTELVAALALYGLIGDGEIGAQVILAAADRDQAGLAYGAAVAMVRADPVLESQLEIIESQKRIVHRKSGSVLKAIAAEAFSKHGFNASMVIYDELHAAPNRELWDVLRTSQGGRSQPLMIAISTAGFDRLSILYQVYSYACKVRDGIEPDDTFLPVIYEAPQDADWLDEKVWAACNPALGDFRSLEDMRILAREAKVMPGAENAFRRLYLNQWTEQSTRAIPMDLWRACQHVPPASELLGAVCFGGLDLGQSDDFSAWVRIWVLEDGRVVVKPRFFLPASAVAKYPNRPYAQWRNAGILEITEGNTTDYDLVERAVQEDCQRDGIREVAYDKRFAEQMAQHLVGAGIAMVDQPQGEWLHEAITRKLELITRGLLCHGDNPILTWMASNYVLRQNSTTQRFRPDKDKAGEKIDGQVALDMAIARWVRMPVEHPVDVLAEWL
jgi:phage terminase large subunit-like protein